MKLTVILILTFLSHFSYAQISKAHVQFSIDVTALDTSEQTQQMVGMFFDSNMKLYFTKTKSRVDYKMGRIYTATMVINSLTDSALVLQSGPMGSFAKHQSSKDFIKTKDTNTVIDVKLIKEYKNILGYKCQKVLYTNNGSTVDYWVTDEIQISSELGQDIVNSDLPGFPLEFSASDGSVKYHYKASNIDLDMLNENTIFSTNVPEGFTLMPQ